MKKIAFFGFFNETNYGDPIIADCTIWLYKEYCKKINIDINPILVPINLVNYRLPLLLKYLRGVGNRLNISFLREIEYKIILKKYTIKFKQILSDIDCIIFVGGGLLKFSTQFFGPCIKAAISVAEEKKIPVIFNSVGVEGYDDNNWKCRILKECLLSKTVKSVSTRDDLNTLLNHYFDGLNEKHCQKVADPAVWVSDCYGIYKDVYSNIVGVNIARGRIFSDYGYPIKPEDLFQFYVELIQKLSRNFSVRLFTNGHHNDNLFATSIYEYLRKCGLELEVLLPKSPKELVACEAQCKGIIATRLHSSIVAYSLDIPFVGLVWNDKLKFFGLNIGVPDYMVSYNNLKAIEVVSLFSKALNKGYNESIRSSFRGSIKDIVEFNINNYIK